jgi:hypothetical protein
MDHRQAPSRPSPSDEELLALLHDYLFLEPGSEDQQLAFVDAADLLADAPEVCWRLIELAAKMDLTIKQVAFFAAGPVEDILGGHGEGFIDRLELAARSQPGMRSFVACVWRGQMSDTIWGRLLALREELDIEPL